MNAPYDGPWATHFRFDEDPDLCTPGHVVNGDFVELPLGSKRLGVPLVGWGDSYARYVAKYPRGMVVLASGFEQGKGPRFPEALQSGGE